MRIEYKKVKVLKEHCGDCGEMLSGNGSVLFPYKCSCGSWERELFSNEYKLKNEY